MTEKCIPSAAIYAGSPARTFEYRTVGVATTPHIRWSFPLNKGRKIRNPVLVAHNQVYVVDSDEDLYALAASSGEMLWCFSGFEFTDRNQEDDSDDIPIIAFCLDETRGFFVPGGGKVIELDLSTGQMTEGVEFSHDESIQDGTIYEVFVGNGQLFLVGYYDTCRLDCTNGRRTHVVPIGASGIEEGSWEPILYHDAENASDLLFGSRMVNHNGDTEIYAYDLDDPSRSDLLWYANPVCATEGDPQDLTDSVGWFSACNPTLVDDTLYAFSAEMPEQARDGEVAALLALEPRSGAIKWRCDFPVGCDPFQLVATSQLVFVVSDEDVSAVDVQTSQVCWNWQATFEVEHALTADGFLYLLGAQGEIVALDAATGEWRWNFQVKGQISSFCSTIDDGTLYIATESALYALSAQHS